MDKKHRLKKIPVGGSSDSSHISTTKRYRVKIDGRWYEGCFSKRWFGLNFEGYGDSGMQLNLLDAVYEICPAEPKNRFGKGKPAAGKPAPRK